MLVNPRGLRAAQGSALPHQQSEAALITHARTHKHVVGQWVERKGYEGGGGGGASFADTPALRR